MFRHKGDIFKLVKEINANAIGFTANAYINKEGKLVMGKGFAAEIKAKYPDIDKLFGLKIGNGIISQVAPDYYIKCIQYTKGFYILAIQVKRHFWDGKQEETKNICWNICEESLKRLCILSEKRPERKIVINLPLVGNCGYENKKEDVKNMVEEILKDYNNIWVCEK